MKTLTIGGNTYEIVDEAARVDIEILKQQGQITIDTTLTKAGEAADAKAVGDALADRVPVTRTVNGKALSANIELSASDVGALSEDTSIPVIDDTLAVEGAAADAKVTGDRISSLELASEEITNDQIDTICDVVFHSGDEEVL